MLHNERKIGKDITRNKPKERKLDKDKKPVSSPKKLILGGKDKFNTRANPHQKARDLTTTLLPEMAASLREE